MMRRVLIGSTLLGWLALVGGGVGQKNDFVPLFNGKDLSGFYTFLVGKGKNNDPDKVFTVVNGMIQVSGHTYGGFITEKEYENYHLVVEWKWGEKMWPPRPKPPRDSGILLHCVGKEGAAQGARMESIECQIIEGGVGDFIMVKGKTQPKITVEAEKRTGGLYYKPGSPRSRSHRPGQLVWPRSGLEEAWRC